MQGFDDSFISLQNLIALDYLNVVLSEDGRAAIKELKRYCFDLIILNWHMPNMYCLFLFKEFIKDHKLRDIYFLLFIAEI